MGNKNDRIEAKISPHPKGGHWLEIDAKYLPMEKPLPPLEERKLGRKPHPISETYLGTFVFWDSKVHVLEKKTEEEIIKMVEKENNHLKLIEVLTKYQVSRYTVQNERTSSSGSVFGGLSLLELLASRATKSLK